MTDTEDTIVAISSPAAGLRGSVRVSGVDAEPIVRQVFRPEAASGDRSRTPHVEEGHATVRLHSDRPVSVPCRLFLWPTFAGYTRQPAAELHTIGSPPLLSALQNALCEAGARPAGPGEFTLRAFLAGRLDLTQAEAVLGVIDAADDREFRQSLTQLAGGLSGPIRQIRERLLDLLSQLEAGLDFADEDIEFVSRETLADEVARVQDALAAVAAQLSARDAGGDRARVVLWGLPNAGKSTLFNALLGREAAAASPAAGTTRDYVTGNLTLAEGTVTLVDTAGVEALPFVGDEESAAGVARAAQAASESQRSEATVRIKVIDITSADGPPDGDPGCDGVADVIALNKCDCITADHAETLRQKFTGRHAVVCVSAETGAGLDELRRVIGEALVQDSAGRTGVAATAVRCRAALHGATAAAQRAGRGLAAEGGEELLAADLRDILSHLGEIVGAVYTDDILDRVFSRFCIGK